MKTRNGLHREPIVEGAAGLLSSVSKTQNWILKIKPLVLGALFALPLHHTSAQVACANCPANGQAASASIGIFVTRTDGTIILPGNPVGACESIVVHTDLGYKATYPGGVVGAGFYGGTAMVLAFAGDSNIAESNTNVTSDILASTKIGPVAPAANACADTDDLPMNNLPYTFTPADIAAGSVKFRFKYRGGIVLIVPCNLRVSSTSEASVQIAPSPSCSIVPASTNICQESSATLSVSASGTGPFTYCWQKGSPGDGACLSTGSTLTFTNVQAMNGGVYTATVTDPFGCSAMGSGTLIVNPGISNCVIAGSELILSGNGGTSNGVYTVLTATNFATPAALWVPISTNNFEADGQFHFTNKINLSEGARFFRVGLP